VNKGGASNRIERLRLDRISAEDSEYNVSVIEEAIGTAVHRTRFLSGCIDQGAGSIRGTTMTMFSHGGVRVSRAKVKSADEESRELRIHHRYQ